MRTNLTVKAIEALKPAEPGERYDAADAIVPGLAVRVTDRGHKSFVLIARFPGSKYQTRRMIAPVGAMELSRARETARTWLEMIAAGIDPGAEQERLRQEAEQARMEALNRRTVRAALDLYETEKLDQLRRGAATRRALDGECGLLKGLLDREIGSIVRADVSAVLKRRAKEAPISANRQLAYASAFFNWTVAEELIESNPIATLKKPSRERQRDRYHTLDELAEIWAAAGTLGYPFGPLYRLLTVLPMRREEIAAMPVAELDLGDDAEPDSGIWTLPGERTKRANALRVPLSGLARSIIRETLNHDARPKDSLFVFTTTGETPVSGFAKAKRRLDAAIQAARVKAAKGESAEPMPHWTVHDLRTTFNTHACELLNIDAAVADRILNHVASATTSKVMRIYNKSELFEPRRAALAAWASLIEREAIGRSGDNVVVLKAARP